MSQLACPQRLWTRLYASMQPVNPRVQAVVTVPSGSKQAQPSKTANRLAHTTARCDNAPEGIGRSGR